MRGLILKDYYCMRKSLLMILSVSAGVIFLAVMFTLSAEYGNVAGVIRDSQAVDGVPADSDQMMLTEEEFYSFYRYVIWIVLFIPMAFTANVLDCFREDGRAGFSKVLFTFPMGKFRIAGARYLSCLLYALVGVAASCMAAAGVSMASDRLALAELLSVTFTFAGVMLIFVAVVMPFVYLLGAARADLVQMLTLLAAGAGVLGAVGREGLSEDSMAGLLDRANRLLTTEGPLFFAAGVALFFLSFLCAAWLIGRRRVA